MENSMHARLENWALSIVERVQKGLRIEDSRVELKREWPDVQKAARRLAGHANAALGSDIIWLIGIDESSGLTGADPIELADWWNQVMTCFDGVSPSLVDLQLSVEGKGISLLAFKTDRAPYVIKNPAFGLPNAGPIQMEVPWREGTSVRSARRNDLIRILTPVALTPEIEFLDGQGVCDSNVKYPNNVPDGVNLEFIASIYIIPRGDGATVFPFHRATAEIAAPSTGDVLDQLEIEMWRPSRHTGDGFVSDSATMERTGAELIAHGPGMCSLRISTHLLIMPTWLANQTLTLRIRLGVVDAERPVALDLTGIPVETERRHLAQWRIESD